MSSIILHSFGYIFQPSKKELAHTGLIHLNTVPGDARVYLERSRFKKTTPTSITGLEPGRYQVSVRLKGYRTWSHLVTISAGRAAAFKNILLLPEMFRPVALTEDAACTQIIPLRGTADFLVRKGPSFKGCYVYDHRAEKLKPLAGGQDVPKDFTVSTLFTGEKSEFAIVYGGSIWKKKYFFADPADRDSPLREISNLFPDYPKKIYWNGDDRKDVFAVYDGYINRLNVEDGSMYPKYLENIKGFGLSGRRIYMLDKNNVILRSSLDKKQQVVLLADRNLGEDLFDRSRFYRIRRLNGDVLLFWGRKGDLIASVPPYRLSSAQIRGLDYNKDKRILLFWSKNNIWTANFNLSDDEDSLFKDHVEIREIYQKGSDIGQCFWVYNASHVLFRDRNKVFLLELNPDGEISRDEITNVKDKTAVFYTEENGYLYYIGQGGNLLKIRILPKEKLSLDNFIEKEEDGSQK